ncbi:MAG: right-handed parallel beta-helix repeat-containing protein [Phycisphaerae bacterium]
MKTKEVGKICLMVLAVVLVLGIPGFGTLVDIAPHNVPLGGPIVDVNSNTWTVTYSSIFGGAYALWDGYYGDQQVLDLIGTPPPEGTGPVGGGWLSGNVAGPADIWIDMGVSYNVQQIKLWNSGGVNAAISGFKNVKIYLDNTSHPTTEVGSVLLPAGHTANAQPYANYTPEGTINLTSGASGRYLTISGLDGYGWADLKGLSEIAVMVLDTSVDVAPHNVPLGGPIVDGYGHTWSVTYSSIFGGAYALWDGYYGDAQVLDPVGPPPCGGGWLSGNVEETAKIFIDMGVSYNVQRIKLWNIGGTSPDNTVWGFKDVKIYLGADPNPTTEVGSGILPRGHEVSGQPYANYPIPDGTINLTSGASGRYLTVAGLSNQWTTGDPTYLKGLSEIGVYVIPPESVDASTFGYDPNDATNALQAAINTHAKFVHVPNMGTDWIVRPITLVSDQEIIFASGVNIVAKRGEFLPGNSCLFTGTDLTGVKLTGDNTTFKMWKSDYVSLIGEGGGWLSANVAGPANIYIDMGTTYTVEQIKLWNFGGLSPDNTVWGFKDVKIYLGGTPNPTTEVGSGTLATGQMVTAKPYTDYDPEGVIDLTTGASGRYLTISGLNNQSSGTTDFKGLSEIGVVVAGMDIAPHNVVPPDGPIVDNNSQVWTVTYSSIWDGFTDTSLWDGYYGDQQHAVPAQWRHGINLNGCTDVTISGITIKETGGDGIYLGATAEHSAGSNIIIRNVICDSNYRQGMTVISVDNLTVDNCTFRATSSGAALLPQCGIDFEPNTGTQTLSDITVKNCIFESNGGTGLLFETTNLTDPRNYSVLVENCTSYGNTGNGIRVMYASNQLVIKDCLFVDNQGVGVFNNDPTDNVTVTYSGFWNNTLNPTYGRVTLGTDCLTAVQPLFASTNIGSHAYMYLASNCPAAILTGASDAGFMGARAVRKAGDVNNDGAVNATDLAAVLAAMDAKPENLNWNVDADLDADNEVTSSDLATVLANFE